MERFFPKNKILMTGNPVRQDLGNTGALRQEGLAHFQLNKEKKTILVIGGSLGAGTINNSVTQCIRENITGNNLQILWQTGKYYYHAIMSDSSLTNQPDVKILAFIDRMDLAYAAADIVISRAGAIAISELCIVGKPVILVPSPNVAEDHQTKNALSLGQRQAAILLRDADAVQNMKEVLTGLINDPALQETLKKNIATLARPDAADRIAEEAIRIASCKL